MPTDFAKAIIGDGYTKCARFLELIRLSWIYLLIL